MNRKDIGLEVVLSIVVGFIGFFLLAIGGRSLFFLFNERSWSAVKCKIDESGIKVKDEVLRYGTARYYVPVVRYSYEFCGKYYTSSRLANDIKSFWFDSEGDAKNIIDKISSDNVVYVSRRKPSTSVLLKGVSSKRLQHHCVLFFSGAFLFVVSAFLHSWF